jgi:hypothetical protein
VATVILQDRLRCGLADLDFDGLEGVLDSLMHDVPPMEKRNARTPQSGTLVPRGGITSKTGARQLGQAKPERRAPLKAPDVPLAGRACRK